MTPGLLRWYTDADRQAGQTEDKVEYWKENIREWTGLELARSKKAVKNRDKWRKLVVKPSVVLQRPLRLKGG